MHGFLFFKLKKYIETTFDSETWREMLAESGLGYKAYWPANTYPDRELFALVDTASEITNIPGDTILEEFGIFLGPGLIDMFVGLINPEWKTLDLIEHTESRMYTAVRAKNPDAHPPQLKVERFSEDKVEIRYYSENQLCSLLKGIARGIARYYSERIKIKETTCMLQGDPQCTVLIERVE